MSVNQLLNSAQAKALVAILIGLLGSWVGYAANELHVTQVQHESRITVLEATQPELNRRLERIEEELGDLNAFLRKP